MFNHPDFKIGGMFNKSNCEIRCMFNELPFPASSSRIFNNFNIQIS